MGMEEGVGVRELKSRDGHFSNSDKKTVELD